MIIAALMINNYYLLEKIDMDFKSGKKSIGGLFSCKKQFVIPRFQREYTWGKVELTEFLDDIVSRIIINDKGELDTSEYFWGSLLLVGDLDDQKELGVDVVDGQQRITTMTIFISVLSKIFASKKQDGLSRALWEYVIGKDANTEEYAVLKNETPKPYFQFIIQKLVEDKIDPKNIEEERILFANKFFKNSLSEKQLKKKLLALDKKQISEMNYIEILRAIRDQLLRSFVICISTTDEEYANMIFEILNAKGKELASVDLIKNALFEKLTSEVPADTAKELWLGIRNNLCSRHQRIEFATFYRHFWISYYGKVSDNKLYADFLKKVSKTEESYLEFLNKMDKASELYSMALKPSLSEDFDNRKEYNFFITESFSINDVYGIVQCRPAILSLLYLDKYTHYLSTSSFRKIIKGLSAFHLMYNAISSKRTSKLEKPLNIFAYSIMHSNSKEDVNNARAELKSYLLELIPQKSEFVEKFSNLQFSKSPLSTNVITKHVLNRWESLITDSDVFESESSIEHISDENAEAPITLNIGNLILLEQKINSSIPQGQDINKKREYYAKSKYTCVQTFIDETKAITCWQEECIKSRSIIFAEKYYEKLVDLVEKIG